MSEAHYAVFIEKDTIARFPLPGMERFSYEERRDGPIFVFIGKEEAEGGT